MTPCDKYLSNSGQDMQMLIACQAVSQQCLSSVGQSLQPMKELPELWLKYLMQVSVYKYDYQICRAAREWQHQYSSSRPAGRW